MRLENTLIIQVNALKQTTGIVCVCVHAHTRALTHTCMHVNVYVYIKI